MENLRKLRAELTEFREFLDDRPPPPESIENEFLEDEIRERLDSLLERLDEVLDQFSGEEREEFKELIAELYRTAAKYVLVEILNAVAGML